MLNAKPRHDSSPYTTATLFARMTGTYQVAIIIRHTGIDIHDHERKGRRDILREASFGRPGQLLSRDRYLSGRVIDSFL